MYAATIYCTSGGLTIARRFFTPQRDTGKRLRVNHQIRVTPVRLIDDEDGQVGIIEVEEALRLAREAELDLVEVSPAATPPVCRIMDYGKWKYQQKKKEQKARSHSKNSELKEVRLRPKIDDHDLTIKTNKAREFLTDGDKVQFTMQFRGREMAHRELGLQTLHDIRDLLSDLSKIETEPRMAGRRMTMVLAPGQRAKPKAAKPPKPAAAAAPPPAAEGKAPAPSPAEASKPATDSTTPIPSEAAGEASTVKPAT